jgi:hypothetical protein
LRRDIDCVNSRIENVRQERRSIKADIEHMRSELSRLS